MMPLSHIVAVSENDVIGQANSLPWNIPEDMAFFKEKTKGHTIIMGRKTFESLGRPLPGRLNIIITRQNNYVKEWLQKQSDSGGPSPKDSNLVGANSIKDAIAVARDKKAKYGDEIFIIGGGEIYRQSMELVDLIYLTRIHKNFSGDVKYPKLDLNKFEEIERRECLEPVAFTFLTYRRV